MGKLCFKHQQWYESYCVYCGSPYTITGSSTTAPQPSNTSEEPS